MTVSASTVLAACMMVAAELNGVPTAATLAILEVEGGRPGQEVLNTNGTKDLGPMQVNTIWVPHFAAEWGVDRATAHRRIRDDACVNVMVASRILRIKIDEAGGNVLLGMAHYNSRNPQHGVPYLQKVLRALLRQQKQIGMQER